MKTQDQIRRAFWEAHPELDRIARNRRTRSKGQNAQNADTRTAFVDFVDQLSKSGEISSDLAHNVTL